MSLADYLTVGTICMELSARKRDEALRALLGQLVAAGSLSPGQVEQALAAVLRREDLGSTAIGNGVAVPHARLAGVERVTIALGYSSESIPFKALDGAGVTEVFLVLAPEAGADDYIEVMERIARLVQNADFRRFLARASDAADALALIKEMDG